MKSPPQPPRSTAITLVSATHQRSSESSPPEPSTLLSPLEQVAASALPSPHMTTTAAKASAIPGFVIKLYRMVNEDSAANGDMIRWTPSGRSFVVQHPEEFSRAVLPRYFKHNNFSSFVRQLNMYGFHKVSPGASSSIGTHTSPTLPNSAADANSNFGSAGWEFEHPQFQRNHPELLSGVKRRSAREGESGNGDPEQQQQHQQHQSLQADLAAIREQQTAIQGDIQAIQRDSQLLWSETMASRERHRQQQEVIDRILRFLASVFSSSLGAAPGVPSVADAPAVAALSPFGSSSSSSSSPSSPPGLPKRQRLMIEDKMDPDLRRQVLELMNSERRRQPSPPTVDPRGRVFDLSATARGLSGDIELFESGLGVESDDALTGFDEPILPDPPGTRSTDGDFDISRYIQDSPAFD